MLIAQDMGRAEHLATIFAADGFECAITRREQAPQRMLDISPRLVVLDLPVVDAGSLAFCENLRGMFNIPVVVCSVSGREWDIVQALDAGADDYLVLPMPQGELKARLHAILRRSGDEYPVQPEAHELLLGDLRISLDDRRVYRRGQSIDLSPTEFRLLLTLVQESGRAVSHSKLLFSVWGPEYVDSRHYLRLYVRYLRSKLEDNPEDPQIILNEWGMGYRFQAKPA
jgi:two-component system KDP operon response regulator KdpE